MGNFKNCQITILKPFDKNVINFIIVLAAVGGELMTEEVISEGKAFPIEGLGSISWPIILCGYVSIVPKGNYQWAGNRF